MIWPFQRKTAVKKQVTRQRIFAWAFGLCALFGFINLFAPLDEAIHGARDVIRQRSADGSTVIVAIDEKTIDRLGSNTFSRGFDARLIDQLFASRTKRVYFDRTFPALLEETGDSALVSALDRHRGKVNFGVIPYWSSEDGKYNFYEPHAKFRNHVQLRSLGSKSLPLSLSLYVFSSFDYRDHTISSISSDISGVHLGPNRSYRPDWSIRYDTVPTVSMLDVLDGKVPAAKLAGKDVIVGFTSPSEPDFHHIIGQGWFPGVYSHAIGAQTLREHRPVELGWLPAFVFAAAASILFMRARRARQARRIASGFVLAAIIVPFIFDLFAINAAFVPAYLLFGIVAYRASALRQLEEARMRNAGTLLPTLSALREEPMAAKTPIIAMRIRNYAAVCASFANPVKDELVTELARRLTLPGESTIFYQAEDVIYWLGPTLSAPQLTAHLEGLARIIESHFVISGRRLDVHVAFGIDGDLARPVGNRIGRALLAADTAAAKHQVVHFETGTSDEDSAWELSLMSELDEAIDAGDIWVAFQPQFELQADRIIGVEALVRWQHPLRGAISPEAFILPAEVHNRIERLTLYVLDQASKAVLDILAHDPAFRLSVNISASLLEQPQLVERICAVLDKTGFPPRNLTLEVTESAPFAESQLVADNLEQISKLGIELSIDDYGTGNATLAYLRSVPCQEIKIDRRFVSNMCISASDMLLVESTIELAHGLGRKVIAEGIEDPETLELLRAIGCDMAQGFYIARPMRIDALHAMLGTSPQTRAA